MTNPLDDYLQNKEAAKAQRKQNELDLWHKWQEGGQKPEYLQPLMKLYEPVIAQKTRMWKAPEVPEGAFKAELQKHLIKAFQTFDPSRNVAINTHVEYRLQKAKRFNNRYQNLAYIPEGQSKYIGPIQRAQGELREELGREPTIDEISEHVGQPPKRIETVMKAMRRDVPMSRSGGVEVAYDYSGGGDVSGRGYEEQQIAIAQNILPQLFPNKPDMHTLFNYTYGTNGHPQITRTNELAKKMGKTDSQVSRMKKQLGETLREHMGLPKLDEKEE